ncbi:hypothetical protein AB0G32_31315 [Streptomyces sp. NPDC023723]|uniref:hypothetical protein n=1 Tax=Streptomyces sp. NPDC023723 TaxID=3154323 RepID=UPI0033DD01AE
MSRRALLGYSGTAAAGAAVGASAPAQAAAAAADETAAVTFQRDTYFSGDAHIANTNPEFTEPDAAVHIDFRVSFERSNPDIAAVEPIDIADALNEFLVSRGFPAMTFYGTPEPAPLN